MNLLKKLGLLPQLFGIKVRYVRVRLDKAEAPEE